VKIRADEIATVIKNEIASFGAELEVSDVGRVVEVGDGIARIYGLSKAMAGELLEFQTSDGAVMGQVFNLELDYSYLSGVFFSSHSVRPFRRQLLILMV